jgi:3-methyladenine DNA glycosylase AlkD
MTTDEIIAELKTMVNPRFNGNSASESMGLISDPVIGLGVGQMKKYAKSLKKKTSDRHALALELWSLPIFEAKNISIFIENPKEVTLEQINRQVGDAHGFAIAMYYSEFIVARTPFAWDLLSEWTTSKDKHIRAFGYNLLWALAKVDKKASDEMFEKYFDVISKNIETEENWVKEGMNNAVWYIGKRSDNLKKQALECAESYWPIKIDYGDTSCITMNPLKHLR